MVIDFHIHYCPEKFVKPNLGPGDTVRTVFSADGKAGDCAGPLRYNVPKFLEMMDMFITLIVVMVPWMYAHVQTCIKHINIILTIPQSCQKKDKE